jgi:hypothetical protein
MNERITRLKTLQSNITRYEQLLKSALNETEMRFVEKRLSEERFALAMTRFMAPGNSIETIALPDAPDRGSAEAEES